jgi:sec-independent protein translocase protein TatA
VGALSPTHLIIILIVALLILGPGKLPETGAALGKAMRELRRSMADEPAAASPDAAGSPSASSAVADATTVSSEPSVQER